MAECGKGGSVWECVTGIGRDKIVLSEIQQQPGDDAAEPCRREDTDHVLRWLVDVGKEDEESGARIPDGASV
jgi:hypothetical protein